MNMTDEDKELALRIAGEIRFGAWPISMTLDEIAISELCHRYRTAKLDQAASGFDEWYANDAPAEHPDHREFELRMAEAAYQAGAASQQSVIAALTEEVERHKNNAEHWNLEAKALKEQRDSARTELKWHKEEVERLRKELATEKRRHKATDSRYLELMAEDGLRARALEKQLQSAQLDNKRLRDLLTDCGAEFASENYQGDMLGVINKELSTPLDTSAADELLARVKNLEKQLEEEEGRANGWSDAFGKERHRVDDLLRKLRAQRDQLTAARSALEEAREALTVAASTIKLAGWEGDYAYRLCVEKIATINAALGEEQKKEGE